MAARRQPARKRARRGRTAADMLRDAWSAAVAALGAAEEETARQMGSLGRTFDAGVHGALASINVPSRQEVLELTRKVDELSRRIDASRVGPRRPARTRKKNPR